MGQKLTDAANEPQGFKAAIDKRTGERIYVRPTNDYIKAAVNIFESSDGRTFVAHALSFEADIDWQKYRMEVAKELIMEYFKARDVDDCSVLFADEAAKDAVSYADALIAELKKSEG